MVEGYVYLALFLFVYFAPTLTAWRRGHHQHTAIFVLNLFLGWTFIGWVLALVWACTAVRRDLIPQPEIPPAKPAFRAAVADLAEDARRTPRFDDQASSMPKVSRFQRR